MYLLSLLENFHYPKRADVICNRNDAAAKISSIPLVFCLRLNRRMFASVEVVSFIFVSVWLNRPRDNARRHLYGKKGPGMQENKFLSLV